MIKKYKLVNLFTILMLILLNMYFAFKSSSLAQCCDAIIYQNDAVTLFQKGVIYELHNYLYPLFLGVLSFVNLDSRLSIAIVQCLLLITAASILIKRIGDYFTNSILLVSATVLIFIMPFTFGFSGYNLSEAITFPLIIFYISEVIVFIFNKYSLIKFLGLVLLSSLIWMSRPAFLWLPFFTLIFFSIVPKFHTKLRFRSIFYGSLTIFLVAFPQYLLAKNINSPNRVNPIIDGVFHLNLAQAQSMWSFNYYRYATNLSGCGESLMFNFSPGNLSGEDALYNIYNYSFTEKIKTYFLHFVSGWDALPGISYVNDISYFPWIFLTLFSGFLILGPILLTYRVFKRNNDYNSQEKVFIKFLLISFFLTQALLLNTATEFRFNIYGWLIAGVIWITFLRIYKHKKLGIIFASLTISLIIFALGLYTLNTSPIWQGCI